MQGIRSELGKGRSEWCRVVPIPRFFLNFFLLLVSGLGLAGWSNFLSPRAFSLWLWWVRAQRPHGPSIPLVSAVKAKSTDLTNVCRIHLFLFMLLNESMLYSLPRLILRIMSLSATLHSERPTRGSLIINDVGESHRPCSLSFPPPRITPIQPPSSVSSLCPQPTGHRFLHQQRQCHRCRRWP